MDDNLTTETNALIVNILGDVFLPALGIIDSLNKPLDHAFWTLFNRVADFQTRFHYYTDLIKESYLKYPCLLSQLIQRTY
jgi:hypothetical protein